MSIKRRMNRKKAVDAEAMQTADFIVDELKKNFDVTEKVSPEEARARVNAVLRANSKHLFGDKAKRLGVKSDQFAEMLIGSTAILEKMLSDDEKPDSPK